MAAAMAARGATPRLRKPAAMPIRSGRNGGNAQHLRQRLPVVMSVARLPKRQPLSRFYLSQTGSSVRGDSRRAPRTFSTDLALSSFEFGGLTLPGSGRIILEQLFK